MTVVEQRRIPQILARLDEMQMNIKELQRMSFLPDGFTVKGQRAMASDVGSLSPTSGPAETAHSGDLGGRGGLATPDPPQSQALAEGQRQATSPDDPLGFEGLEAAESASMEVAEATAHVHIRARIDATEAKLRLLNHEHYIGTPRPVRVPCHDGQGGVPYGSGASVEQAPCLRDPESNDQAMVTVSALTAELVPMNNKIEEIDRRLSLNIAAHASRLAQIDSEMDSNHSLSLFIWTF